MMRSQNSPFDSDAYDRATRAIQHACKFGDPIPEEALQGQRRRMWSGSVYLVLEWRDCSHGPGLRDLRLHNPCTALNYWVCESETSPAD